MKICQYLREKHLSQFTIGSVHFIESLIISDKIINNLNLNKNVNNCIVYL